MVKSSDISLDTVSISPLNGILEEHSIFKNKATLCVINIENQKQFFHPFQSIQIILHGLKENR